mmetsp:Transcript_6983/g.9537  ORF Transcript_6983/g.9537 Transcript_6983/m.9537 type:complete len:90 (+) Transcript_6983:113-382(+)
MAFLKKLSYSSLTFQVCRRRRLRMMQMPQLALPSKRSVRTQRDFSGGGTGGFQQTFRSSVGGTDEFAVLRGSGQTLQAFSPRGWRSLKR